jgi:hypothetical protein
MDTFEIDAVLSKSTRSKSCSQCNIFWTNQSIGFSAAPANNKAVGRFLRQAGGFEDSQAPLEYEQTNYNALTHTLVIRGFSSTEVDFDIQLHTSKLELQTKPRQLFFCFSTWKLKLTVSDSLR